MNILRVVNSLYPSAVGGTEIHAHELSRAQASLGNKVTVLTSRMGGWPATEDRDGYHIIRTRPLFNPLGNAIQPTVFLKLVDLRSEMDIIHAHSHLSFSSGLCAAFRHVRSTPLVITDHGLISQTASAKFQDLYLPTVARWIYRSADGIICYTEVEKAGLVELGIPEEKIAVIHNGIDTGLFRPASPREESEQLLWIGRYTPGKGVRYLIDAFAQLKKDNPRLSLLMVGKGPEKAAIAERVRELGLNGSVIMNDFVPNDELPDIYRRSRAFVLPSIEEGVPRALLEAMACGVPAVCTSLPQLVDIVSGAGLLVPVRDSRAIAEQLSRILSDDALSARLGEVGTERVRSQYSWDDTVRRTLSYFEGIITN
ncbi:MAG: glycosyltransferase family 4 protein [Methanomassiliicoccus sp.]|nr:glycosyltransferase family 4 protein [Methanomassiliicoccus sp.]